ncbi:MAG: ATP-binding cassette domain-containing protein [Planctomycetaceae bacterium]|jgi:molybdate transport system ATP-binding protein|nr:ATP-binding cassette domain-containing protein [Planctomycetaceae bacterium]
MSLEADIVKKLSDFTLDVHFKAENERLGLLGASGCGKTMTLKCIAGIAAPDSGRIVINGKTVFDSVRNINLPPQKRRIGYLFQQYALFPTMTVRENMEIVLRHFSKAERKRRIDEMITKLNLYDFCNRKPSRLSGGQQQRAAMARILVTSPELIMLDEPLSALDSFLRNSVENELMRMLVSFDATILFVSHNRDEVFRICERMFVLQDGQKAAFGTTEELFRNPGSLAAARLTGVKNTAPAFRINRRKINVPDWGIALETAGDVPDDLKYAAVRAHHIYDDISGSAAVNCFCFQVLRKQSEPFKIQELLRISGEYQPLIRFISGDYDPVFPMQEIQSVRKMFIPPEHVMLLTD